VHVSKPAAPSAKPASRKGNKGRQQRGKDQAVALKALKDHCIHETCAFSLPQQAKETQVATSQPSTHQRVLEAVTEPRTQLQLTLEPQVSLSEPSKEHLEVQVAPAEPSKEQFFHEEAAEPLPRHSSTGEVAVLIAVPDTSAEKSVPEACAEPRPRQQRAKGQAAKHNSTTSKASPTQSIAETRAGSRPLRAKNQVAPTVPSTKVDEVDEMEVLKRNAAGYFSHGVIWRCVLMALGLLAFLVAVKVDHVFAVKPTSTVAAGSHAWVAASPASFGHMGSRQIASLTKSMDVEFARAHAVASHLRTKVKDMERARKEQKKKRREYKKMNKREKEARQQAQNAKQIFQQMNQRQQHMQHQYQYQVR
jgi:hypothetical protein